MKRFLVLVLVLTLSLVGCKEETEIIETSQIPDVLKNVEPHIATLPQALQLVLVDAEKVYNMTGRIKSYFWEYGKSEITEDGYVNISDINYAIVDMDNDGKNEVVVDNYLLKEELGWFDIYSNDGDS